MLVPIIQPYSPNEVLDALKYPAIRVNTDDLREYANHLRSVQNSLYNVDAKLDLIRSKLFLFHLPSFDNLANLLFIDFNIGYSWKLQKCMTYLRDTASDFDDVEKNLKKEDPLEFDGKTPWDHIFEWAKNIVVENAEEIRNWMIELVFKIIWYTLGLPDISSTPIGDVIDVIEFIDKIDLEKVTGAKQEDAKNIDTIKVAKRENISVVEAIDIIPGAMLKENNSAKSAMQSDHIEAATRVETDPFREKLSILRNKEGFTQGTYWGYNGTYVSIYNGQYVDGSQCFAMAKMMQIEMYGKSGTPIYTSNPNDIQVGDVLHFYFVDEHGATKEHWVFVIEKKENSVVVGEGNYRESVNWDREISFDSITIDRIDRV